MGRERGPHLQQEPRILRDFFKFQVLRGNLHGDPTLAIERARKRGVYRTTFATTRSSDRRLTGRARDRVAVRLLLNYALRKGALKALQFKHFDHHRKRVTVFTKGEKVRDDPDPPPGVLVRPRAANPGIEAQPTTT